MWMQFAHPHATVFSLLDGKKRAPGLTLVVAKSVQIAREIASCFTSPRNEETYCSFQLLPKAKTRGNLQKVEF